MVNRPANSIHNCCESIEQVLNVSLSNTLSRHSPLFSQAFAHHVMAKKFRDASEAFFAANCAPFRGVDPKGEQLLEYTEV